MNVSSEGEKLPVQLTQKVKECGDRAAIERCSPRDTKERIVTKHTGLSLAIAIDRSIVLRSGT